MNNEFDILAEGPIAAGDIGVVWEAGAMNVPGEAARRIEERWAEYVEDARRNGRSLFNGRITRLIEAQAEGGGLRLRVGPGEYKHFLTTTLRDREWFAAHAPKSMIAGLGNSVLLTHGEWALMGIRSHRVAAYPGRAHLLGGVLDELGTAEFPATVRGLIGHLLRELQEEAHVAPGEMSGEPELRALVRDHFLAQPELIWRWETRTPLEEIAARIDAEEHAGVVMVSRGGELRVCGEKGAEVLWTPVAEAAVKRWRR